MDGVRELPGRPLLSEPARPWAGFVLACCAVIVAVLAVLVLHRAKVDWLDSAVDAPFIGWFQAHKDVGLWLIYPASPLPAGVLSVVIALGALLVGRLNGAVLAALALPTAEGLTDGLLKPLVDRTYYGNVVYPSGHTTGIFTLAATLAVLLLLSPRPADRRPARAIAVAAACGLGLLVAMALIGLRWHYFTDTVAGASVGIGTVCGLALLLDLPAVRRALDRAGGQLSRLVVRAPS